MFSKIALFALLVATAQASGGYSSFSYGVSDPNTGDIKDQQEKRVGGNVVGKYSLLESDGTKRIVEYAANDATGFNAVVRKEPAGALGAAAFGTPLTHAGALGAIGPLAAAAPFAHGALSTAAHLTHASPLAAAAPLAAAGGLGNPLAYGNSAHLAGHSGVSFAPGSLYGGYGNPLASSLGYAGRGAPTVSSYSHSIVHNGPDSYPYGGAYGRYGAYGGYGGAYGAPSAHGNPWAAGAALAPNSALAHGGAWAPGAALSHGALASPLTAGAYGPHGVGYGSQLGW